MSDFLKQTVFIKYMRRLDSIFIKGFNVYYDGSDSSINERDSVGFDMALMSRCNYTILSYGTYSFWSGFLSGGPKILPVHMLNYKIEWNQDRPKYFQDPFYLPDVGISNNLYD